MSTFTIKRLKLKSNLRCQKIYPTESSTRTMQELKTVAIRLSRPQAIELATILLAAAQNWETIDITAFRKDHSKKTDDYPLSVTSQQKDAPFQDELRIA